MAGRLIYLIGASGVGKDSLISYAREQLSGDAPVAFAHRYITRPREASGEAHVPLSVNEFAQRDKHGCFAMTWSGHGFLYGIGVEIGNWMSRGLDVVVNGSRAYFPKAAVAFPNLLPLLVQASQPTLRERLIDRGREDGDAVEKRIARAVELDRGVQHPALITIDNNAALEQAGERLLAILTDRPQL